MIIVDGELSLVDRVHDSLLVLLVVLRKIAVKSILVNIQIEQVLANRQVQCDLLIGLLEAAQKASQVAVHVFHVVLTTEQGERILEEVLDEEQSVKMPV